jgi:hypothetical protein
MQCLFLHSPFHITIDSCPLASQRVSRRYGLLDFLQQNKHDWMQLHAQLKASKPRGVDEVGSQAKYPFELLLRLLRSSPGLVPQRPRL